MPFKNQSFDANYRAQTSCGLAHAGQWTFVGFPSNLCLSFGEFGWQDVTRGFRLHFLVGNEMTADTNREGGDRSGMGTRRAKKSESLLFNLMHHATLWYMSVDPGHGNSKPARNISI